MSLSDSIGVVVITSPVRSHPSTEVIMPTLRSLSLVEGLQDAPITVVCDGCRPASSLEAEHAARVAHRLERDPCGLSKRGIVADEVAAAYETFQERLVAEAPAAGFDRLSLLRLRSHAGFALAVQAGLKAMLALGLRYALVVQHDRAFCRRLARSDLNDILAFFDTSPSCRYVGFPSGISKKLPSLTADVYGLRELLEQRTHPLRASLSLRPSIFWYDSNHLVDAARALEILAAPYQAAPEALVERLGGAGVGRFRLRRGDFIEDRFGVEQRSLMASLVDEPSECMRYFDWFGTYLLEELLSAEDEQREEAQRQSDSALLGEPPLFLDRLGRVTYVDHIDGRGCVPPSERGAGSPRQVRKRVAG